MSDYSEYKSRIEANINSAYLAAEQHKYAIAIQHAWQAESYAAEFAKSLERARVEAEELKRG